MRVGGPPPGYTASASQPAQVSTPSMTGEPAPSGVHLTPSNLRGALRPNLVARLCWSSVRTLTANILPLAIRGQVFDVSAGQKTTSGGSFCRTPNTLQGKHPPPP